MRKTKTFLIILFLLLLNLIPLIPVGAFEKEVSDFDRIWYHPTDGFNKNGVGTLIVAISYTNATLVNPSLREIDYCSITYNSDPFYFEIEFQETLEIIRDPEGNIISQEPSDGYLYLRKSVIDNHFTNIKELASENIKYSTIVFNGDTWYRIYIPDFNREYKWKKFSSPSSEKWYTWGSSESVSFNTRAMFVRLAMDNPGSLVLDVSHPDDSSGQTLKINKTWLASKGVTTPIFEYKGSVWERLSFSEDDEFYIISPPHFSDISMHEATTGTTNCYLSNGTGLTTAIKSSRITNSSNDDTVRYVANHTTYCSDYIFAVTADTLYAYEYNLTTNELWVVSSFRIGCHEMHALWMNSSYIFVSSKHYYPSVYRNLHAFTFNENGTNSFWHKGNLSVSNTIRAGCSNGSYLYCAASVGGLISYTFNGTDFTEKDVVGSGNFYDVYSDGRFLYVANNDGNLSCFSVSGDGTLAYVSNITNGGSYCSVWGDKNFIYAGTSLGIRVYTVTSTGAFTYKSTMEIDGACTQLWSRNSDYLFAVSSDEIKIYEIISGGTLLLEGDFSGIYSYCVGGNDTYLFSGDVAHDETPHGIVMYTGYYSYDVTRVSGAVTETNNVSFSPVVNRSGSVTLKVPVSGNINSITEVYNWGTHDTASSVTSFSLLVNNTYYHDVAREFVHIRIENITTSSVVNWSVNASAGVVFDVVIPTFLEVGDYLHLVGMITDSSGVGLDNLVATTHLRQGGEDIVSLVSWNITGGNYQASISTNGLLPGLYEVIINVTDATGASSTKAQNLYLSTNYPSGFTSTLTFSYYNKATGLGISSDLFKTYVSTDTTIDESDRVYKVFYQTSINETLYYKVSDYFGNKIYPTTISYATITITSVNQFEDIPIAWNSFSVKNMNHSIVWFNLTSGPVKYSTYIYPYEQFHWYVLNGTYTVNITYYNPETDAVVDHLQEDITITKDRYYWVRGYDLQDIIIEVRLSNTSVNNLNISITSKIVAQNSNITTLNADLNSHISLICTNVTAVNHQVWNALNITDSKIDWMNLSITNNLTFINTTIKTLDLNVTNSLVITKELWGEQNESFRDLRNRSRVMFSFYNTNTGLGIPWETLRVYLNDTRLTEYTYECTNGTWLHLVVNDYYNNTMLSTHINVSAPFTAIGMGLTLHSWLFGNMNEDYYMISLLKSGASRWWERGLVPYGEREFLIPSGTYCLRIYDRDDTEIYNSTLPASISVVNSKVYVIFGTNLSLVID